MVKLTIEDHGDYRHVVVEGKHYRFKGWQERSELDTSYSEQLIRLMYEIKGDWILDEYDRAEVPEYVLQQIRHFVDRYGVDFTGKKLLDFGCGSGATAITLVKLGAGSVVGVDTEEGFIRVGKMRCEENGLGDRVTFQHIEPNDSLDFIPDGSMDYVCALDVLEHVSPWDRKGIVRTLWRKLKPGGSLLISGPNSLFPYDMHTTDLWFTAWLPLPIALWYGRTFSKRCKGMNKEQMMGAGIRHISYFEMRRYLSGLQAIDIARVEPCEKLSAFKQRTGWKRILENAIWQFFRVFVRPFAPWEAIQVPLHLCFRKQPNSDGTTD